MMQNKNEINSNKITLKRSLGIFLYLECARLRFRLWQRLASVSVSISISVSVCDCDGWLFTKFHAQFRTAGTQTRFSNWNSNSKFVCSGKRFKTSTWRVQLVPKTVCLLKPLPKPQLSRCFVSAPTNAAELSSCRAAASCIMAAVQFLCCCFCCPFAISLKATKCQINTLCDPRSNHLFLYPVYKWGMGYVCYALKCTVFNRAVMENIEST